MTDLVRTEHGTVSVAPGALAHVVARAAESVGDARVRRPRRGLNVELLGTSARVSLELTVRRGAVLPEVAREVQERVSEALRTMCEATTVAVDVSVEGVH